MKIADLIAGVFRTFGDNETSLVSFKDDPPKHRLGLQGWIPGWGRSLGAISFNRVSGDHEDEHVLIQGKSTNPEGGGGGELYIGLKAENAGGGDGAMIDVMTATVNDGFRFALPIYAPNLGSQAAAPDTLKSRNGIYWLAIQDDGNYVKYKNMVPFDYNTGVAVWASGIQ